MLTFNRKRYINEMKALIAQAKENLRGRDPQAIIYTISIWTDIDAAVSAVSFDTIENSNAQMENLNAFMRSMRGKATSENDLEKAAIFAPIFGRNTNPAGFAFTDIAEYPHIASFVDDWNERPAGRRWNLLEPALLEVGELARGWFSDLRLHPEAELAVNGRQYWYEHTWSIGVR